MDRWLLRIKTVACELKRFHAAIHHLDIASQAGESDAASSAIQGRDVILSPLLELRP
ncbi:MAG: hypothetical protein ACRESJ_15055 [Pseudomonas sp.]|uniref:hypothetical protein n=1 Tax=Pseudomonas sp. TaxID=306 RepID=UPI003D6E04F0